MKLFNSLKRVFTVFSATALWYLAVTKAAYAFGHTDILFYVWAAFFFAFVLSLVIALVLLLE